MKIILVDAIGTFILEGIGIFEKMHDLLERYPNEKIILTSANDEQVKMFKIDEMPYKFFTLKHEPEKTDPEYYRKMLVSYDFSPDDVVYFEHDEKAVKSARSVGITAYHYDMNKKDLELLKEFLDKNLSE
jgi:HAD superfamily hydrolase (TIGR01509 family)